MGVTFAYLRTSTLVQTLSMEAQEARILSYCQSVGLAPPRLVYDVGVSASTPLADRPGGRKLMALVGAGSRVVAFRLDRLFRNTVDCLTVMEGWDAEGVPVYIMELGRHPVDLSTSMGRFLLTVSVATAEMEAARAGESTSKAMRQKAAKGEFTGGEPPFGTMVGPDRALIPCAREQAVITLVREYRADGASLRRLVQRLEDEGVVGRTGKPLAKTQVIKILSYGTA